MDIADALSDHDLDHLTSAIDHRIHYDKESGRVKSAAHLLFNFGQLLAYAKRWQAAEVALDQSRCLDPSGYGIRADPPMRIGNARWHLGDLDGARQAYENARDCAAPIETYAPPLADVLMHLGRYQEAAGVLDDLHNATGSLPTWDDLRRLALAEILTTLRLDVQERTPVTEDAISDMERASANELLEALRSSDALDPRLWMMYSSKTNMTTLNREILVAHELNHPHRWAMVAYHATVENGSSELMDHIVEAGMNAGSVFVESFESIAAEDAECELGEALEKTRARMLNFEAPERVRKLNIVDVNNAVIESLGAPET